MKIIFDSEEQKKQFMSMAYFDYCPSWLYLNEKCGVEDIKRTTEDCKECWKNCGLEVEVKDDSSRSD